MARQPPHNPDLHVVNPDGENKNNGNRSRRREIAEAAFITVVVTLLVSGGASMLWNFSKKRAEKLMRKRAQAEEERELLPGQYAAYAYAAPQGSPVGRTIPTSLSMDPRLQPVDVAAGTIPVVLSLAQDPTFTHFARALDKRLGALERDVQGLYDEDEDDGPGDDEDDEDDEDEKPAAKTNTRRKKTA